MKSASKRKPGLAKLLSSMALGVACLLMGGACGSERDDEGDVLTIGVLLPFTGPTAGTASNFERAVLLVADQVNEAGGVQGKKLRVVSRDTHSDLARSKRSVEQLLEEGAQVVLGPESAELASEILPTLRDNDAVFLSPLVGSAGDSDIDCAHPWFRLAPSARALGESLAKLAHREGSAKVAILYSSGAYDEALEAAFDSRFEELTGMHPLAVRVDANAQTHAAAVSTIVNAGVDSIVLATSPRAAALAINEFEAAGLAHRKLFLSPLLKTGLFVQNVAPAAVEGALGVAPGIFDDSDAFHEAFSERWRGDTPLEGAYFYYDATALVALALEKMGQAAGRPDYTLVQALLEAAGPPGEAVQWDEVTLGLSRTRDGRDVYYAGLTGPMLLDKCGARKLGKSSTWTIHDGVIENEAEQ